MLAPKGFTQHISQEAFVQAHVTAQKKVGILRFQIPLMLLTAAFSLGGVFTIYRGWGLWSYLATGVASLALAAMLTAVLVWLPRHVKKTARQAYQTFEALSDPAEIVFESDEMLIKGQQLTRRVEYAKTRLCIETAARFVIVTDDDAVVMLETACFEDENIALFLRDVFARWYRRG